MDNHVTLVSVWSHLQSCTEIYKFGHIVEYFGKLGQPYAEQLVFYIIKTVTSFLKTIIKFERNLITLTLACFGKYLSFFIECLHIPNKNKHW